ncbi:hypothetical protein Prudu_002535 [Prunus dulcis]|uniref:HAT C-terminal dimerisation domain-containing protein n=1 Tax=Prunus dulcis TaxID=3755 RepID=A0A4Y1QR06_PRUDU|nr:hypothetical protein Prudu_002535 [Prunus dulcis]
MSGVPENNEAICSGKNGKSYHGMEEALGELAISECIKVYEERKWWIKEYLGNLDGQISLSVDVLGYENVRNFCSYDYVCLSAHFIDENWKLRKWVLYFRCLWDPSVNCSEDCGIFKSLEALEIADKISTLATSNDRCYAKMFEYVKTHVQEKKELQLNDVTDSYDVPSPEEWKIVEGVCKIVDSIYEVSNALSPEEWKIVEVKGGDGSSQVAAVLGAFHKLFDDYVIRFPEKENFISESSSSDSDSEEESPPRQENHTFAYKKSDLEYYLEEPVLPWSQDFNALTWWRTADLLAIPVSLATSFDAFYTKPRPVDERLVCLKPDLMNSLICTRSWYGRYSFLLSAHDYWKVWESVLLSNCHGHQVKC